MENKKNGSAVKKLKSIKKLSDSLTEKAKNKFMVQKKQLSAKEKAEQACRYNAGKACGKQRYRRF